MGRTTATPSGARMSVAAAVGATTLAVVASMLVPAQADARPSFVAASGSGASRVESLARSSATALLAGSGVDGTGRTLRLAAIRDLGGGDQVVRFQQVSGGVPVYAGEVSVQVDGGGAVLSVTGETASGVDGLVRRITPPAARTTALRVARQRVGVPAPALAAGPATAYVYDPVLVGEPDTGARPVWQVVVSGPPASGVTVEVLVDAGTGAVAEVIDRTQRLSRTICDNRNDPSSNLAAGSWCTPSDYNGYYLNTIDSSRPQAVRAYADLGDVSNFYAEVLGVDLTQQVGLDTARPYANRLTPALTATVNHCEEGEECPYPNAFWVDADPLFVPRPGATYPGGQVYLGRGLADAEDVVAHEVTHGVTSSVNALKYLNQSGAINESMSDVFGQLSQLYDADTDTFLDARDPRWLIGEQLDVPSLRGAVRSMSNPATTSLAAGDPQPDRMTSKYWERSRADNGGVHANNGVGNKTAYLIARGGTFNGYRVKGIGHRATARLYWRTQQLLTSGASYRDLAVTLSIACNALYGRSGGACRAVRSATAATEIAKSKISVTMKSSTVGYGKKRTIKARLVSYRGGALYIRSSQKARLVIERRYLGSKKWKRLSSKRVPTSGRVSWAVHPKRSAVYRVKYAGSASLGLRAASKSKTLKVRRR